MSEYNSAEQNIGFPTIQMFFESLYESHQQKLHKVFSMETRELAA
jgi:hypothetical protein